MRHHLTDPFKKSAWLRSLILLVLVLGIFFRFLNLEHKVYWGDETLTSVRISGYTATDVAEQVFDGRVISVADLQKYQHPSADRDLADTLRSLVGSPEHSPLYYLAARFWTQSLDRAATSVSPADLAKSVWIIRSLSAVISLLAFPCVYWLCLELFQSSLTGWVAIALVAASPFHVLYAQEARPYSLWIVTILLSSAALLRAIRLQTRLGWAVYAITVALGLYSFLFSGLVAIAHGVYVVALSSFRWSKTVAAYLIASLGGLLLFAPWLAIALINFAKLRRNVAHLDQNESDLVQLWLLNLSRIFFDFNHGPSLINPLIYLTFILTGYSFYWLYRKTPNRVWLFILTLVGVMGLTLILADLVLGGRRSTIARYPIPCYLGIQLAVAHFLTCQITSVSIGIRQRRWWQRGFVTLLLVGILSCAISSQVEIWWNKGTFKSKYNAEVADLINQTDRPLLISDNSVDRMLSLSYLLDQKVRLQLVVKPNVPQIPDGFSDVFLYQPSRSLRNKLERRQNYQLRSIREGWLWQATPKENGTNLQP